MWLVTDVTFCDITFTPNLKLKEIKYKIKNKNKKENENKIESIIHNFDTL